MNLLKRARKQSAGALVLILLWASCTAVREDRTDCPCSLYVSMTALPQDPVSIRVQADALCYEGRWDTDTTVRVEVRERSALVTGIAGGMVNEDGYISIQEGSDCPAVFLSSQTVPTVRDSAQCRVHLHKHFATLGISFDGPSGWGNPYSVGIRGRVAGLYPDGAPVEGDFHCSLAPGKTCRLPRQAPGEELWLDITMPEGVLRSFALGTYLDQAGFDWTAEDLKDIALRIDLSVTAITFTIGLWSTTVPLDIVI